MKKDKPVRVPIGYALLHKSNKKLSYRWQTARRV